MRQLKLALPVLFVLCVVPPANSQPVGDVASREELLKVDKEWAQAAATRNVERIVSYWTDDAVIYPPDETPVEGKEAIRLLRE